jgi:hypothetical protein
LEKTTAINQTKPAISIQLFLVDDNLINDSKNNTATRPKINSIARNLDTSLMYNKS